MGHYDAPLVNFVHDDWRYLGNCTTTHRILNFGRVGRQAIITSTSLGAGHTGFLFVSRVSATRSSRLGFLIGNFPATGIVLQDVCPLLSPAEAGTCCLPDGLVFMKPDMIPGHEPEILRTVTAI